MNIQMMGNRVLVEVLEEEKLCGIQLPEAYASDQRKGVVVAVGNGRKLQNGRRIPIEGINVGDIVLLPLGMGPGSRTIDLDGRKYFSVIVEDLLGVLER
jgi:chaperonin GroES